jgi:hypothetical protein
MVNVFVCETVGMGRRRPRGFSLKNPVELPLHFPWRGADAQRA